MNSRLSPRSGEKYLSPNKTPNRSLTIKNNSNGPKSPLAMNKDAEIAYEQSRKRLIKEL
jgi:hypothetical protein